MKKRRRRTININIRKTRCMRTDSYPRDSRSHISHVVYRTYVYLTNPRRNPNFTVNG
jgi:hypothetical protein